MNFSLTSISEIANDFIYTNKLGRDEYLRCVSVLFRGLTFHQIYFFKQAKSKIVEANSIGYFNYPEECVSIIRLGVIFNGRVYPIYPDDTLDVEVQIVCAEEVPFLVPTDLDIYFPTGISYDGIFSRITYKEDKENRRIRVNGDIPASGKLLLTFVHNGVSENKDTYVSRAYYEVLYTWLEWKRDPQNMVLKENYANFLKQSIAFKHRFTQDDLIEYFRLIKSRL